MHIYQLDKWKHAHQFHHVSERGGRNTIRVIWLTGIMMAIEIACGMAFGSMALLADGWHMGTHAAALGITALAYRYARLHADDPRYSFGTGKVGVLGGYTSAVVLAVVALLMGCESIHRFFTPTAIRFNEAIYPKPPEHYKDLLKGFKDLVHITVEVNVCDLDPCLPDGKNIRQGIIEHLASRNRRDALTREDNSRERPIARKKSLTINDIFCRDFRLRCRIRLNRESFGNRERSRRCNPVPCA